MVKGISGVVTVSAYQAVTFRGRTLGSVRHEGDFVVVNRKRERGNTFDDHFYRIDDVIAFREGEGGPGRDSVAFAIVMTDTVLKTVAGIVSVGAIDDIYPYVVATEDNGVVNIASGGHGIIVRMRAENNDERDLDAPLVEAGESATEPAATIERDPLDPLEPRVQRESRDRQQPVTRRGGREERPVTQRGGREPRQERRPAREERTEGRGGRAPKNDWVSGNGRGAERVTDVRPARTAKVPYAGKERERGARGTF